MRLQKVFRVSLFVNRGWSLECIRFIPPGTEISEISTPDPTWEHLFQSLTWLKLHLNSSLGRYPGTVHGVDTKSQGHRRNLSQEPPYFPSDCIVLQKRNPHSSRELPFKGHHCTITACMKQKDNFPIHISPFWLATDFPHNGWKGPSYTTSDLTMKRGIHVFFPYYRPAVLPSQKPKPPLAL